ncbi:hypothetical protein MRX96_024299 [Rhipicephalus microplus]
MEDRAFGCDLNIEWPPTKREQGQYATGNIQADYNTSSQVETRTCDMSSAGTRTILRCADACRRVAAQVELTRGHVVSDAIESFLTTATCRARRLCEESDPDFDNSTRIAEGHLQLGPVNTAVVGDLNFSEDSLGKRGTLATTENVDHFSGNRVHVTCEVFDSNAVEFSRIKVRTKAPQCQPCGPGPKLCLQQQPRLPDFSLWPSPASYATGHRTCGRPIASGDTREQSCLHADFSRSRGGSRPEYSRTAQKRNFQGHHAEPSARRPPRSSVCQCSLLASGASRATTTMHLRLILTARALDSTFKLVINVVVGITVVLWRSGRGRAAARRLQRRRFPLLPDHDDTDVMRLRPPTARRTSACCEVWVTRFRAGVGYLGRSFALKLCQPIVILYYRKRCRRSRPWTQAPRAISSRSLSLLEATSKVRRRPSPAHTKALFLGAWRGGLERHVISPFHLSDIVGVFQGYLGRSFALKLCQPIVILAYRKCCRRSRPWAKAPRATLWYDTPLSAVSYCVIGTKICDGPPYQRRPRLVTLALNANDWRGVPCDAAPTFLAWG